MKRKIKEAPLSLILPSKKKKKKLVSGRCCPCCFFFFPFPASWRAFGLVYISSAPRL
jgi:hypothetical protein